MDRYLSLPAERLKSGDQKAVQKTGNHRTI